MLSKDTFCRALRMIQEQQDTDRKFAEALQLVGNGPYVFGTPNRYHDALLLVLKETVNDQYDYIDWWLYEGEPDYEVSMADGSKTWILRDPETLYDFIREECQ